MIEVKVNNNGQEDNLLQYVNACTATFRNGSYGRIHITPEYHIKFETYDKDDDGKMIKTHEPLKMLGRGFIAFYCANDGMPLTSLFKKYFRLSLNNYIEQNKYDSLNETESEWIIEYSPLHIRNEKGFIDECHQLFEYLSDHDRNKITEKYNKYIEWIRKTYHLTNEEIVGKLREYNWGCELTEKNEHALAEAVAQGYIIFNKNHLKWDAESVLLDYFVGKLFCDDYIKKTNKYQDIGEWETNGKSLFNKKQLQILFDYPGLGEQRKKHRNIPKNYIIIDRLFERQS